MRTRLGLCLLGLLGLHSAVFMQVAAQDQPGVLIFCDDVSVEKAVHSAVDKFNGELTTGHKLGLFQILSARKSENGSDSLYSVEFTSRATDCLADSATPWTDCEYLPHGRQDPFPCNATVYMTETDADTREVFCRLDHLIHPERGHCMGCPENIDENSEDLRVPVTVSISKFNSIWDSTHLFSLHTVGYATRQVVAGFRYKLGFDMRKTNCAKAEHKEVSAACVHDAANVEFAYCNSTVDVAPWRLEPPQAQLECEAGPLPPSVLKRRRPPGWSPLRRNEDKVAPASSPSTTHPPTAAPTKASSPKKKGKEESSEEDTKTSKPSTSPDATKDNPFHCPSKPWKPFSPLVPARPAKDPAEATSQQPAAEGTLKDSDLLA